MSEDNKASNMAAAILDYIYEEGDGKVSNAEVLGILELVKTQVIFNALEGESE